MTCWAIAKAALSRGHKLTVLSLFDNSPSNPYLDSKDVQTEALKYIGADVEFIHFKYRSLIPQNNNSIIGRVVKNIINPDMERYFPWTTLRQDVEKALKKIRPDGVFCYHFDALSAVYNIKAAPIMAGVGDLCHLPVYFRWKAERPSARKYLYGGTRQILYNRAYRHLMSRMLKPCSKRGAFAAHYADWFRKQNGFSNFFYLRTPAEDPLGEPWKSTKEREESSKPRVLMIGDLATTSTSSGLEYLGKSVLPTLDREFGSNGFEIHLVGGEPRNTLPKGLQHEAVKFRGRVNPPDKEFLKASLLLVPTPITLGIRVRIITAFSFATCVVAHKANAAGIPELQHRYNCLLTDSGSKLGELVASALKNKAFRSTLASNGRETYERYFSEDSAAGLIVKEMEEMEEMTL